MGDLGDRLRKRALLRAAKEEHNTPDLDEWKAADRIELLEGQLAKALSHICPRGSPCGTCEEIREALGE